MSNPANQAVIRRLEAAEETPQERLLRKHVPAWVISGAVHVGLIAVMILLFGNRGVTAKPAERVVTDPQVAKPVHFQRREISCSE